MKKYVLMTFVTLTTVIYAGPIVNISDVQISPSSPTVLDLITIEAQGYMPSGAIHFDESVFSANAFSLELNIYYTDRIGSAIPKDWFHNEEIGALPQGNFDLLVQGYWRSSAEANYILHDSFSTTFEVIPEPFTFAFLALGGLIIRA